jgi:hypothetical protein
MSAHQQESLLRLRAAETRWERRRISKALHLFILWQSETDRITELLKSCNTTMVCVRNRVGGRKRMVSSGRLRGSAFDIFVCFHNVNAMTFSSY